jgi:hypothetical protein
MLGARGISLDHQLYTRNFSILELSWRSRG